MKIQIEDVKYEVPEEVANLLHVVSVERDEDNGKVEIEIMRLVACGVAAMSNTHETIKSGRISKDSPYWSASYGDVCDAVDREIKYREALNKIQRELWPVLDIIQEAIGPKQEEAK